MGLDDKLPLKEFLRLDSLQEGYEDFLSGTIRNYRRYKAGFEEDVLFRIFAIQGLERNLALQESVIASLPEKEMTREIYRQIPEAIEKRVKSASVDELAEVCDVLQSRIKADSPKTYYDALVGTYFGIAEDLESDTMASYVLTTYVVPILTNSEKSSVSKSRLKEQLPADQYKWLRRCVDEDPVSIVIIKRHFAEQRRRDDERKALHLEILDFAKEHFGKDHAAVCADIYSNTRFKGSVMINEANNKSIYLLLGVKEIEAGSGEFAIDFFKPVPDFFQKRVAATYRALRKAERGESIYAKPKYKSYIDGNSEEKDKAIISSLKSKFPDYIGFTGDYFGKNSHGSNIFFKLVEINVPKISRMSGAPERVIRDLFEEMKSLIGEPPSFLDNLID
jgi:hypothetical protein